jgi:predicted AAA+ superfamily ATPase
LYKRPVYSEIFKRLKEPRRFMQVLIGPRQTGKTTLAQQIITDLPLISHYATADEPGLKDPSWIEQQWEAARIKIQKDKTGLLVLDEIQKIPNWSETVKRLWDEDTSRHIPLLVLILGSSAILLRSGLTESLAGRFEIVPITHWSFGEMRDAFGFTAEAYIFYGGYPGAADLISDFQRWSQYITESLIETTVSRDILLMSRVDKPALLRRLFELGCTYSGQILSYQKMLGQLFDAGNTTTLAHYLELLNSAGLLTGLSKYSGKRIRQRASSPKLNVLNTGLMSALSKREFDDARNDTEFWGRLVESAVGATILNGFRGTSAEVFYWIDRDCEVDFVLKKGSRIVAIEVKSGRRKTRLRGIEAFSKQFRGVKKLLVGTQGIPMETFLASNPIRWFE